MVIWGIWLGMNLVLNSTWGKNHSFVQEFISYSRIVSKSTLNTCTSKSFPMVAIHIKVMGFLDGAYQSDLNFRITGNLNLLLYA